MRDSVASQESGDQTVANRRRVSEAAMFGSAGRRRRRLLLAILSLLFALGFAVSAIMVSSERDKALDIVVERGRDEAQFATATLTGKELAKPITGSDYERLADKIWKSVSSKGSIAGVTIWSSHGRVLFSLNESRVGKTPAEMQSLITGIAEGSDSTRVLDGTLQTFTRVTKGQVVIVEVDQPLGLVDAQTSDLWSTLRLGSAVGLAVSLLFLGLTFVSSKGPARVRDDAEPARLDERQEAVEADETKAQGAQPETVQPSTEERATYAELFGLESDLHAGIPARGSQDGDHHEGPVIEAGGQPSAEPLPPEQVPVQQVPVQQVPAQPVRAEQAPVEQRAPASEERVQAPHADLDEAVDQVGALDADGESPGSTEESTEESMGAEQWPEEFREVFRDMARGGGAQTQEMRQRREEFKNRAKQAELRLKKQDAELHEAPSAPSSER
jgi:hypothetical protein